MTLLEACQLGQPYVQRKQKQNTPEQDTNPLQNAVSGPTAVQAIAKTCVAPLHFTKTVSPTLPMITASLSLFGIFLGGQDTVVQSANKM